jgi:hypothetical protein
MSDTYNEIVALNFNDRLIFDKAECIMRLMAGESYQLVSRQQLQIMAAADLGPQWEQAANAPTLFKRNDM